MAVTHNAARALRRAWGQQAQALLLLAALAAGTGAAHAADLERGRLLYENHCQFCHSRQVHGRTDRWPNTRTELRGVVDLWQRNDRLRWSDAEIDDVTAYLNATQYRFEK
jgi:mono/diheme cytochrome c family protein